MITIYYSAVDGHSARKQFEKLEDAQKYAYERIGDCPCLSPYYAISDDGVGKIEVMGTTLSEIFPKGY